MGSALVASWYSNEKGKDIKQGLSISVASPALITDWWTLLPFGKKDSLEATPSQTCLSE